MGKTYKKEFDREFTGKKRKVDKFKKREQKLVNSKRFDTLYEDEIDILPTKPINKYSEKTGKA